MNLGELREMTEYLPDETPIRVALQPSYPLGGSLECVVHGSELSFDDLDEDDPDRKDVANALWLAVSDGEDYSATREMWQGAY